VLAPNKTLAAQLYGEMRELFPKRGPVLRQLLRLLPARGVRPASDTYIEKDAIINDAIDRMRHAATRRCCRGAT
jgi:excinuclease ABC subunit B